MRAISRRDGLGLEISVAAIADLASTLDTGLIDVVLVGPHLATDFSAIEATVAVAGGVALLLANDAFGPDGATAAIELIASRVPHPTEGIPRV
jgi:cellobiose-specific phosphotransferase system component IIB